MPGATGMSGCRTRERLTGTIVAKLPPLAAAETVRGSGREDMVVRLMASLPWLPAAVVSAWVRGGGCAAPAAAGSGLGSAGGAVAAASCRGSAW